jgi:hypothetical protein
LSRLCRTWAVAAILGATACATLDACGTDSGGGGGDDAGDGSPGDGSVADGTIGDATSDHGEDAADGTVGEDASDAAPGIDAADGTAADVVADVVIHEAQADGPEEVGGDGGVLDSGADAGDAGVLDAGTDAGGDAGVVDSGADAPDGGDSGDAGCTGPSPDMFNCAGSCNGATSYCVGGAIPNVCEPLPAECTTCSTHDCACLLAHAPSPCNGTISCTAYDDGGQLWLFASNCH